MIQLNLRAFIIPVLFCIMLFAGCDNGSSDPSADNGSSGPSADNGGDSDQEHAAGQVKITIVGDINLGSGVGESVELNGNGDYKFPFLYVADYLKSADITVGNLESIISDKGTDTKQVTGVSLRAAPGAINGLLYAGFDVVSVANNHFGDWDFEAMQDGMSRLTAAGISYVGGGNNFNGAHSFVIKEINGQRIAFLGYSCVPMYMDAIGLGQTPTPKWIARADRAGLAWAHNTRFDNYGNLDQMANDIKLAKASAGIVIVMWHFGWEYEFIPRDTEKVLAHAAIDAGATLVVGHHPHVVQWLDDNKTDAIERYNGGYIAYSLGNFIFDISSGYKETELHGAQTHGLLLNITVENGAIKSIEQVKTHYHDDYWQAQFDE
ncbi:MAG TPA: CapA family protein [Spirochaetota bacterium]|nr:CapA family protein [Spirochaetota bacterium]